MSYIPVFTDPSTDAVHSPMTGDNRLYSVKIYMENPELVCIQAPCRELVTTVVYRYDGDRVTATILDAKRPNNSARSREIEMERMEDGRYYIQSVVDRYKDGKGMERSKFVYSKKIPQCLPGKECQPVQIELDSITRTDAKGNLLSEILDIRGGEAVVVTHQGVREKVAFATLNQLLKQARKIENKKKKISGLLLSSSLDAPLGQTGYLQGAASEWTDNSILGR